MKARELLWWGKKKEYLHLPGVILADKREKTPRKGVLETEQRSDVE